MPTPSLIVKLTDETGSYRIQASLEGTESVSAPFDFESLDASRTAEVIGRIAAGDCGLDDLRDVGSQLFEALFSGEAGQLLEQGRAEASSESQLVIRLSLPSGLQLLPWEAVYDEKKDNFLASNPKYCLLREPPDGVPAVSEGRENLSRLRVLVVIPAGSGLSVEHEWRNLSSTVEKFGDAMELGRLDGRVTPDRLQQKLTERAWDVLHFIGHGEVSQEGSFKIRLSSDESSDAEFWMEAETFSSLFRTHPPRLVVLNCCLGAAASPVRTLSGLGPSLLKAGVPAIVAMRYEIPDHVAVRFSDIFYRELLVGQQQGRVDLALTAARRSLYLNQREDAIRGFVTPVLYLAPGHQRLFQFAPSAAIRPPELLPKPSATPGLQLPEDLVTALRDRKCIAILGPEILRVGALRFGTPPPGPKELVELLGQASQYPRPTDLELARNDGEWMASLFLPCVCQHYQKQKQRFKLIEAIRGAYKGMDPPAGMLAIASLNLPAIVYTHFDGLLEDALHRAHKIVQVASRVEQRCGVSSAEGLLVCVRGTLRDESSLVLTEEDHELLWERMGRLPRQTLEFMRGGLGCSRLYMGISPRDPLIRRLSRQLLGEGSSGIQGPTFIVCAEPTQVDEAYWQRYDVHWIPSPLDDFVEALTRAVA